MHSPCINLARLSTYTKVVMRKEPWAAGQYRNEYFPQRQKTSHSAHPEAGINPAQLCKDWFKKAFRITKESRGFSLLSKSMPIWEVAFGTTQERPVSVWTLRAFDQQVWMNDWKVKELSSRSKGSKLEVTLNLCSNFAVSVNDQPYIPIVENSLNFLD